MTISSPLRVSTRFRRGPSSARRAATPLLALCLALSDQAQPRLTKAEPANGAKGVPCSLREIVLGFDQAMDTNGWTLRRLEEATAPGMDDERTGWRSERTFVVGVQGLAAGVTYGLQLNGINRTGFKSVKGEALPITGYSFVTASADAAEAARPTAAEKPPAAMNPLARPAEPARASASGANPGYYLSLFVEPYQGAFYMLLPKGWKTEGGMIPSGVPWNKVDLIESNIRFRATSPDGKSFFGWYPKFYFSDPRHLAQASMGILNPQPGTVSDGVWLYPYMTIPQFAQTIIFNIFAKDEFQNPRLLGGVQDAPDLRPWVPKHVTRAQCGYVNFECGIKGVAMRGRLYAILGNLADQVWSNNATYGLVAPTERWGEDSRLMEYCIRTFRLNPQWVAKASAAEIQRGRQMADLQRQLNEADLQMQREHLARSSDSQNEFYKVLTGQMEVRDPATKEEKWMPAYNRAYTDGNGNYYLSDYGGSLPVEGDPNWRPLQIINRNAQ